MVESAKASRRSAKLFRCAIYTRKSSEEGLEQAFNSLHAQREACAAFILSQKHEGWAVLPTLYDDGGFSGGTMDRPALQRLLSDIGEGKLDVVVVYKIDRLTRSLFDFAKIVEALARERRSTERWPEMGYLPTKSYTCCLVVISLRQLF
jgi:site-specific DNA recombinase